MLLLKTTPPTLPLHLLKQQHLLNNNKHQQTQLPLQLLKLRHPNLVIDYSHLPWQRKSHLKTNSTFQAFLAPDQTTESSLLMLRMLSLNLAQQLLNLHKLPLLLKLPHLPPICLQACSRTLKTHKSEKLSQNVLLSPSKISLITM